MVEGHGGEEDLGAVCVAQLPREQTPELVVVQEMGPDFDPEVVLGVGDGCEEGGEDNGNEKTPCHWRVGKA